MRMTVTVLHLCILLQVKCPPLVCDIERMKPWSELVSRGKGDVSARIIQLLVNEGADPTLTDIHGRPVMHIAAAQVNSFLCYPRSLTY